MKEITVVLLMGLYLILGIGVANLNYRSNVWYHDENHQNSLPLIVVGWPINLLYKALD